MGPHRACRGPEPSSEPLHGLVERLAPTEEAPKHLACRACLRITIPQAATRGRGGLRGGGRQEPSTELREQLQELGFGQRSEALLVEGIPRDGAEVREVLLLDRGLLEDRPQPVAEPLEVLLTIVAAANGALQGPQLLEARLLEALRDVLNLLVDLLLLEALVLFLIGVLLLPDDAPKLFSAAAEARFRPRPSP